MSSVLSSTPASSIYRKNKAMKEMQAADALDSMDDFEEASFVPGSSTEILISKKQPSTRKLLKKMPSVSHHSSQLLSSKTIKKAAGAGAAPHGHVTHENTLDV